MKKTISIMLCLLLIFSSVSLIFAVDWSTTDSNNLANIKNAVNSGGGLYNLINAIDTDLFNLFQIDDADVGRRSITWWVREAVKDLDKLVIGGTGTIGEAIFDIRNSLVYYTQGGNAPQSWLATINTTLGTYSTILNNIFSYMANISGSKTVTWMRYQNGTLTFENRNLGFFDSINSLHNYGILPFANMVLGEFNQSNGNYNSSQNAVNWGNLGTSTFIPSSAIDGIYKWLSAIQAPVARLSYVLASDEEIEAREKAATNQASVVDNFIDSTGGGSISPTDISSVSNLSYWYERRMNTDASPSGIWNIFNESNFGWFSQETANQLDTTVSTRKGNNKFNTPLLDQQIANIYKELGVDVND